MGAFICQISESDWMVSRVSGIYGNREGSEKKGKVVYFRDSKRGEGTIQSIIEDLIGMKNGDIVFFHVIRSLKGKSSIHGVYRVSKETYFCEETIWESNPHFVYPYRFCFEPHPDHAELCANDSRIYVSEFYRAIENRDIRSVVTLEREVMGAAHAVKTIIHQDANQIIRLLYRDFKKKSEQERVKFQALKPQINVEPLRKHIRRIGEIEFSIKALIAYDLGKRNPRLTRLIPACRKGEYDFLIETFIGQTTRKPVDLLCIEKDKEERNVTILEAKTTRAGMEELVQALQYVEVFRTRNHDIGSKLFKMSACLLAQKFDSDLINYTPIRNRIIPWEEIVLLKYVPLKNGTDAEFNVEICDKPSFVSSFFSYPRVDLESFMKKISINPAEAYSMINNSLFRKAEIELESRKENTVILNKYCYINENKTLTGKIFIRIIVEKCNLSEFEDFLKAQRALVNEFQGDLMAIEPIIIAKDFDRSLTWFIQKYNQYETKAMKQPISSFQFSES